MTKKDIPPATKEDKSPSRRLSLHRKTPSTGSAAIPAPTTASISPKASSQKSLLHSPARKAVGLLNAISPGRRRSEPHAEVAQAAKLPFDAGMDLNEGKDTEVDAAADSSKVTGTPETTKSLEHLSMEDSAKSPSREKAPTSPPRNPPPSIIAAGKLSINRPVSLSPPALPPRSIHEFMKPTPPRHIEDTNDGMVVDPSSSEHAVEPELVAVEDADPPPPPLIYEVEDDGTPLASLGDKDSWDTKATVEPVDYNMWDDTNSVPLNFFSEENTVDNTLGLSDGIQTFQLSNRSADLETHNQLGPGVTYLRMLTTGMHVGHQAVCIKPAREQTSNELPSHLVQSALASIPERSQEETESKFETHWIFCIECAGWFRIIGGVSTSDEFLEDFRLRSGSEENDAAVKDAEAKLEAIVRAVRGSEDHRRPHHFHQIPNAIPQPPSMDLNAEHHIAQLEQVNDLANLSSYNCCYCGLFLAYDTSAIVPSVFSNDLLDRLFKRDPMPGDAEVPVARFYRTLKLLHTILRNILTGKQNSEIKADAKAFVEKIGTDEIGKELMERSGFQWKEVEEDEIKRSRWVIPMDDESLVKQATRAWVELGIRLAAPTNPSRMESHASVLQVWDLASVIQSTLSRAIRMQPRVDTPGDRRTILDAPSLNSQSRLYPSPAVQIACTEIGCSPLDSANAISLAVVNQTICDPKTTSRSMDHLEVLATHSDTPDFFGAAEIEKLQSAFVTIKSSGFPTSADIQTAYSLFGFDESVIRVIEEDTSAGPSLVLMRARQMMGMSEKDEQSTASVSPEQQKYRTDVLEALETLGNGFGNAELSKEIALLREEALELPEALKALEIGDASSIEPEFWEIIYKSYVLEVPESFQRTKLKNAFEVIAKRLNPPGLRELLGTGKSTPPALPAGLFNIGNTCYLNSLLQYLYAIRDLRVGLQARQEQYSAAVTTSQVFVGGRVLAESELERSRRFVQELVRLFNSLDGSQENAVRPEKELAYLALVTAADEHSKEAPSDGPSGGTEATLVNDEPMDMDYDVSASSSGKSVLGKRSTEERDLPEVSQDQAPADPSATQDVAVAANPQTAESTPMSPTSDSERPIRPLRNTSQNNIQSPKAPEEQRDTSIEVAAGLTESALVVDSSSAQGLVPAPPPLPPRQHRPSMTSDMMFGQQHDISECMDNVLFQVEAALASDKNASDAEDNLVKRLFYGKAKQQLLLPEKSSDMPSGELVAQPSVEVIFNNILLSVNEERGLDLYDKLHDMYFGLDDIEIDGVKGKKSELIEALPPLLHIQLQRVQFDQETKSAFKSNAYIKFAETLALDRFLPVADPEKREKSTVITRHIAALRTTLSELQYSKAGPVANDLDNLREALFSLDPEQEYLYSALDAESARLKQAVADAEKGILELRAALDELWRDEKDCEYELSSVFMHRGSAGFGHYWLYQRNLPEAPDTYFQFNDETVRSTTAKEVLQDTTGSNANPYLLVYAKKGSQAIEVMTRERKRLLAEHQMTPVVEELSTA